MNLFVKMFFWGLFLLILKDVNSQSSIDTLNLEVTFNKTSSVIFPAVIKSVDRGSRDILAQKAKGVGNVLQLKAGRENFPETNLTVITSDGILHQLTVNYSGEPSSLTIDISKTSEQSRSTSLIFQTEMTENDLENYSSSIASSKRSIRGVSENNYKINLALLGVYIKDDVMFYRFKIENRSNINYDVDFLKFYIRDKAKMKRTASQEIELKPLYTYGNDKVIKGKSETDIIYALEKLTIPESKLLSVEMFERNGGRHFKLGIKNKTIVNADVL